MERGWLYLDPAQQLFTFRERNIKFLDPPHYYNVEITQGAEYCWIQKAGYTDPNTGEFIEPEVVGDQLLNISGEELNRNRISGRLILGCFIDEKRIPSKYLNAF